MEGPSADIPKRRRDFRLCCKAMKRIPGQARHSSVSLGMDKPFQQHHGSLHSRGPGGQVLTWSFI